MSEQDPSFVRKLWERKITRFLVVGCFNTAFDISLLLVILKLFSVSPLIANSVSVSIAITVSYFLNHSIVFRQTEGYSWHKYLRFFLVTGLGVIVIQDAVIYLITDRFWIINKTTTFRLLGHAFHSQTIELLGAKLTAILIGLSWNYLLYKYVVFHGRKNADNKEEIIIA